MIRIQEYEESAMQQTHQLTREQLKKRFVLEEEQQKRQQALEQRDVAKELRQAQKKKLDEFTDKLRGELKNATDKKHTKAEQKQQKDQFMRGLQDEEMKSASHMRSRMEEEDETLRQNHQAQLNALNETQQAQLDELRAAHKKALDDQQLQDRKRSEDLLVTQSKELALLLGLEQQDLIDVVRSQIFEHRSTRSAQQLSQHELLASHCAALMGMSKLHQQQLADDIHNRHSMQLAFCEKDKKHTIDKNALLKSHEADNTWLKQQQDSLSQRVDQACREKEAKLLEIQNKQQKADCEYAKKQLDNVRDKLQSEHDRVLRFVTEALRSNTIADSTIDLPQFTVPTLSDMIPNYTDSDDSLMPPVTRAPSAPKDGAAYSSSSPTHRSHSSLPDDGLPPSRPPPVPS